MFALLNPLWQAAGELREGACGPTFVEALSCFVQSPDGDDKGMDCLTEFKAFKLCLSKHHTELLQPNAGQQNESNS